MKKKTWFKTTYIDSSGQQCESEWPWIAFAVVVLAMFVVVMIAFGCARPFRPVRGKEAKRVQEQLWNTDSIRYFDSTKGKWNTVSTYEYYKTTHP